MRLSSLLLLPIAAALARAAGSKHGQHKVKESIIAPPQGWILHAPAPSDYVLELRIALPQPHFPILEQHLWEVSDPKHVRYGDYLSREEAEALMMPHPESVDAVGEWLATYGIYEEHLSRSSAQDWVTVRVPVGLAEVMLGTVLTTFICESGLFRVLMPVSTEVSCIPLQRDGPADHQNNQL
ncbi:hypothetical protein SCLCIDRAFT_1057364 [Scleroderma citrinum Foug A]|uniref:Peptidase S53 activation domain-containing protein n=1 Tax=Scleroderma citrinum Foug A TaxID=1036808 RepID=A0A0C3DDJ8_9AGAM|nr:hypothetical protein SCLCIDRAFT_1057364 [Scleroderma citrinum Foug A]